MWIIEYTDEFGTWWTDLTQAEQEDIATSVTVLENIGPDLKFPYVYSSCDPSSNVL